MVPSTRFWTITILASLAALMQPTPGVAITLVSVRLASADSSGTCQSLPLEKTAFTTTDTGVTVWGQFDVAPQQGDMMTVAWVAPNGTNQTERFTSVPTTCQFSTLLIRDHPAGSFTGLGSGFVDVYLNGQPVAHLVFSMTGSAPPPPPPPAPTNLQASVTGSTIDLTWDAVSNTTTQLVLKKQIGGTGAFQPFSNVQPNATTFSDQAIVTGTVYCYRLTGSNSSGAGLDSNTACSLRLPAPMLALPADGASVSSGPVTLTWNAVDGSDQFDVQVGTACGSPTVANATVSSPSYAFTAAPGTTYEWSVRVKSTTYKSVGPFSSCRSLVVKQSIPPPKADFSFTPPNPTTASDVVFQDRSTNASRWHWTFGDGQTSEMENPSHRFANPARYNVQLLVSNESGQDNAGADITITPPATAPVAEFTWSPQYPNPSATVTFTNQSQGTGNSYLWNFADGTGTSSSTNPSHTFAATTDYTVTLTATNEGGKSTASHTLSVGAAPTAVTFSLDTLSPRASSSVGFIGSAKGSVESWLWSFGDTATGTGNPTYHTFAQAGDSVVKLTARNRFGDGVASAAIHVDSLSPQVNVGDRVAATVDLAGNNTSIHRGDTGTFVCSAKEPGLNTFVNWDHPVQFGWSGSGACVGTAYEGYGWGVDRTQLERSSTPRPPPPTCKPNATETRSCTYSAECVGIQSHVCSDLGTGWGDWRECVPVGGCVSPLPAILTTIDGFFILGMGDRDGSEVAAGIITYTYHAAVTATIEKRVDSATGGALYILRRLDQSVAVTAKTGAGENTCEGTGGISTDFYDGTAFQSTIHVATNGSYLSDPLTITVGGYTDTYLSAIKPNIKVNLAFGPSLRSGCSGFWLASGQKQLY